MVSSSAVPPANRFLTCQFYRIYGTFTIHQGSFAYHSLHTHLLPIHLILFFTYPFYSLHRHQCNAHKIYSLPPELHLSMRFVSHTVLYSDFQSSSRHCLYTFRLDCTYFYLWNEKNLEQSALVTLYVISQRLSSELYWW